MKKYLFILLVLFASANAEIEKVTLLWTIGQCRQSCPIKLHDELSKVYGVKSVSINEGAAQADILWQPGVPFSYPPVYAALARLGLNINLNNGLRVRVIGKIVHDNRSISLISRGDNTKFMLLGPLETSNTRYMVEFNPETHVLPPETRDQLINAEMSNSLVTIEGAILQPERSPPDPLMLIAERIQVSKPEQK